MSWSLFSEAGAPIALHPSLPSGYRGLLLPGGTVLAGSIEGTSIVVQELHTAGYALRLNYFEVRQRTILVGKLPAPHLQARVQLRGSLEARVEGLGTLSLRESQYTFVGLPPTQCRATFETGVSCQSLDTFYPETLLQELTPYFPWLEKSLNAYSAGRAVSLTPRGTWSTAAMLRLVEELLRCPFAPGLREVYLENKVRELLVLQLDGAYKRSLEPAGSFTTQEVAAAYEVRRLILSDLEQHHTIQELARRVGLNEFTLKGVFKGIFGKGPFEYLLEARMARARELLLESDTPMKVIAGLTGYAYLTSFITAFRKYFGYTPASLRRRGE